MKENNKGFTLVEVLVAIVILGVLSSIAIVGVQSVMNSSRNKYYKSLREMIIAAAKEYYSDNKQKLPVDIDDDDTVTLEELIEEKYIDKIKDANGDICDEETSIVTVTKETAKDYSYTLILECPDPKMPDVENESNSNNRHPKITFKLVESKLVGSKKATKRTNKSIKMCISGRTDYTYELYFMKRKKNKFTEIRTKKGNLNTKDSCIDIPLNAGSGSYYVVGRSGDTIADSRDFIGNVKLESSEPSCEGLKYNVNHVSKQWFKDSLDVKVSIKTGNDEKYFIEKYDIEYGGKKFSNLNGSNSKTFNFDNQALKDDLVVTIYNDLGESEQCDLGNYWMDNDAPKCVRETVNTKWNNNPDFFVTTDCDDQDVKAGRESEAQSGCREKQYKDDKEGEIANIVIEDKVGNKTTCTFSKMKDITAPVCETSNYNAKWYSNAVSSPKRVAWATCDDPLDFEGKKLSGCKEKRLEDDTEGATTQFTIEDNAGNVTKCGVAEKYIDNTKPTCGTRSQYNGKWSPTNKAWVQCNDQQGLSGCVKDTFENTPTDGRLEKRIVIEDIAGNKENCDNVEKYRDTVPPKCTYTASDPKLNLTKKTETDGAGNTLSNEMFQSYTVDATAVCKDVEHPDDYSKCKQDKYTATQTSSSSLPPDITVEDNAGNTTKCTKSNIKDIVPVGCPTVTLTSGTTPGIWTNKQTAFSLKFPGNVSIKNWPSKLPSFTGSGTNYSVRYSADSDYPAGTYQVCDSKYSSYCAKCQMPAVKIDTIPPRCTYTPGAVKQVFRNQTEYSGGGTITNEVFDHFQLSADAICEDVKNSNDQSSSSCKKANYHVETTSTTSTKTPDIAVEDNAGNVTQCNNNSNPNSVQKLNCPTRSVSGTISGGTWTEGTGSITLNFDQSVTLSDWNWAGKNSVSVTGSGSRYVLNYSGEGDFGAATYKACNSNACVRCQIPSVKIDRSPPSLSASGYWVYDHANVCVGKSQHRSLLTNVGSFQFQVRWDNLRFQDSYSGIKELQFESSLEYYVQNVSDPLNETTVATLIPTSVADFTHTNRQEIYVNSLGGSQGQQSTLYIPNKDIYVPVQSGGPFSFFSDQYGYCFSYCVAVTGLDMMDHRFQFVPSSQCGGPAF